MDIYNKKKRKTQSIQDMMRPADPQRKPLQKSGYQGAYRRGEDLGGLKGSRMQMAGPQANYAPSPSGGGLIDYAWIIYCALLGICILVACIFYSSHSRSSHYRYPTDVFTMTGVLTDIYTGHTSASDSDSTNTSASNNSDSKTNSSAETDGQETSEAIDEPNQEVSDTKPGYTNVGVTSGAPMTLDDGTMNLAYGEAESYEELLTQLESAIASGDVNFVGSKVGYFDGSSTLGYPQSVVDTFVSYMAGNADKRSTFLSSIKNEEKYGSKNGDAIIVSLPIIQFKIKTDYENTTFTFSGFSEQTINPGQEAVVSPLLPCMYNIIANNDSWEQPVEGPLEATFGENLEVNFGAN